MYIITNIPVKQDEVFYKVLKQINRQYNGRSHRWNERFHRRYKLEDSPVAVKCSICEISSVFPTGPAHNRTEKRVQYKSAIIYLRLVFINPR